MSVILSKHGSVRGMEGGVGKAVESFRENTKKLTISPLLQRIQEDEMPNGDEGRVGKVVLYVTSVQVIRETHELCKQVVHILRSRRVAFIQKDVFLHPDYGRELSGRLEEKEEEEEEEEDGDGGITLPQLFVDGKHVGNGEAIIALNESGKLRPMLERFETSTNTVCRVCGGQGFIMCLWCEGSKKGIRNAFGDLKCTVCNKNALQKCPECSM